jgi:uncharacterized protein YrrD
MLRGSDLIGRLVVSYDNGEKIERIQDLVFDRDSNRLLCFVVEESGWFRSARVIPFEHVQSIGVSAVIVPSRTSVLNASELPQIQELMRMNNVLQGTRIMTINGRDLGTIADLYFDRYTGKVEGYEVSGGVFADAHSGRSYVPAPQAIKIGKHVAFVPVETVNLMEEQNSTVKYSFNSAGEAITEIAELSPQNARSSLPAGGDVNNEKLQETAFLLGQKSHPTGATNPRLHAAAKSAAASITKALVDPKQQKMVAIGKTVQQEVVSPDGIIIADLGSIVTPAIADLAERYGVLGELYRATGSDLAVEASVRFKEVTNLTSRKLQQIAEIVSNKIESTNGHVGVKFNEVVHSTTAALTNSIVDPQEQKTLIIGKIVDCNVTDPDKRAIALAGQEVTLQMAELAEDKGVLDRLFRAAGENVTDKLSQAAHNLLADLMLDETIGRRVRQTIWSENGGAIAVTGQIVTQNLVIRVRDSGKQAVLLDAVGLNPDRTFGDNGSQRLTEIGDLSSAVEMKEPANSWWEKLTEKLVEFRKLKAVELEKRRIDRALGRPVSRVIFDPEDRIILNAGDLVTHQAIAKAREAGLLDALLGSIYVSKEIYPLKPDPSASGNKLHLPVQGEVVLNTKSNNGMNG